MIADDVDISVQGFPLAVVSRDPSAGAFRIFEIGPLATVSLSGLDIQGGMRVVLQADTKDPAFVKKGGVWNQDKLETVARIMRHRVDFLGLQSSPLGRSRRGKRQRD